MPGGLLISVTNGRGRLRLCQQRSLQGGQRWCLGEGRFSPRQAEDAAWLLGLPCLLRCGW